MTKTDMHRGCTTLDHIYPAPKWGKLTPGVSKCYCGQFTYGKKNAYKRSANHQRSETPATSADEATVIDAIVAGEPEGNPAEPKEPEGTGDKVAA